MLGGSGGASSMLVSRSLGRHGDVALHVLHVSTDVRPRATRGEDGELAVDGDLRRSPGFVQSGGTLGLAWLVHARRLTEDGPGEVQQLGVNLQRTGADVV